MADLTYEHDFAFPVSKVTVLPGRFRKDDGPVDDLMASIDKNGLQQPIGVTPRGTLIWGKRRLVAHKNLEREDIRAYIVSGADEEALLDMEHDENMARRQFHWSEEAKITAAVFEMQKRRMKKKGKTWSQQDYADVSGLSTNKISRHLKLAEAFDTLPDLATLPTQDEAMKEYTRLEERAIIMHLMKNPPESTKNAPHWANEHYVIRDALDGMEGMADESFDFAEVDPPYGIELDRRKGRNLDKLHTADYNEVGVEAFPTFMKTVIGSTYRLLKPNTFAVFWYGMQWHCEMFAWLRLAGFMVNPVPCIWYKGIVGQTAQPDVAFGSVYEPFWLARKGTPKMRLQGKPNVFHFASVTPARKIHTTEKPIELLSDILDTILFPGSNVLVPFLGSGVTLRAAYRLGHTGLGFDLSPENKARFIELVAREHKAPDQDDPSVEEPA